MVRVDAAAFVLEVRDLVRADREYAVVVGGDDAEAGEGAAVDHGLDVEAGQGAVVGERQRHVGLGRVAAAAAEKRFVAVEEELDGPPGPHREEGGRHLEGERVALAAEAAADLRPDHLDPMHRQPGHLGQRPVHVVRHLRRRPHRQAVVGRVVRDDAVRFGEGVRDALEVPRGLGDDGGVLERLLRLAERLVDVLLDVRVVDADLRMDLLVLRLLKPVHQPQDRFQFAVLDLDGARRRQGRRLVLGRHHRHVIAHVAHLLESQRLLVLRQRQHAEGAPGHVLAGQDGDDAVHRLGRRRVDLLDACVRLVAADHLRHQHVGKHHVVGVDGLAGHLERSVDQRHARAQDLEAFWRIVGMASRRQRVAERRPLLLRIDVLDAHVVAFDGDRVEFHVTAPPGCLP